MQTNDDIHYEQRSNNICNSEFKLSKLAFWRFYANQCHNRYINNKILVKDLKPGYVTQIYLCDVAVRINSYGHDLDHHVKRTVASSTWTKTSVK